MAAVQLGQTAAVLVDLLEDPLPDAPVLVASAAADGVSDGSAPTTVALDLRPFQLVTVRLTRP